jgi:hypothetical protein
MFHPANALLETSLIEGMMMTTEQHSRMVQLEKWRVR